MRRTTGINTTKPRRKTTSTPGVLAPKKAQPVSIEEKSSADALRNGPHTKWSNAGIITTRQKNKELRRNACHNSYRTSHINCPPRKRTPASGVRSRPLAVWAGVRPLASSLADLWRHVVICEDMWLFETTCGYLW